VRDSSQERKEGGTASTARSRGEGSSGGTVSLWRHSDGWREALVTQEAVPWRRESPQPTHKGR
jgi:hypothetical protein